MLTVEVFELAVVVSSRQLAAPLVGEAGKVEGVARLAALHANAPGAAIADRHVLVVGGIALVDLGEPSGVQGQIVDFLRAQVAAAKGLGQ
ncbi:hypothetical protein D9M70_651890 [compost metagenome]